MSKLMQSPVNKVLASTQGHVLRFRAGKTTRVPDKIVEEAQAFGATVVDEQGQVDTGELDRQEEQAQQEVKRNRTRKEMIYDAVDKILAKGDAGDFTAANKPKVEAVKGHTGFSVKRNEIDEALRERNRRLARERLEED